MARSTCCFLVELTALKQFFGDRDLGSDEQQQVDGKTQKLFILELVHLNQLRVGRLHRLRYSNFRQNEELIQLTKLEKCKVDQLK